MGMEDGATLFLASGGPTAWTQMLGSGLIGIREGLETGIVVMVLAAFLVKSGRREALKYVWIGVSIAVSLVVAIFLGIHFGTQTLTGMAAEAAAGIASLVAVVIVTSMVLVMKKAAGSISGDLKAGMDRALEAGPFAVILLAFLAVGREGLETALLMVGYAEGSSTAWPFVGLIVGVLVAVASTYALYLGAVRIDLGKFFKVTGVFLVVVAAGILSYAVHAFQAMGWLPGLTSYAFHLDWYDASSWYGTALAGIFNITPEPTWLQLIAWLAYLVVVLTLFLRPVDSTRLPRAKAAPDAAAVRA
ncbi:iron uptake transporter permease EfeU [Dietzia sp.]|uniref:iron uptake transporter permease EfeU n=1 Tax=Dietzia sp. TaxID=1871616 RepID=UPI002FDA8557